MFPTQSAVGFYPEPMPANAANLRTPFLSEGESASVSSLPSLFSPTRGAVPLLPFLSSSPPSPRRNPTPVSLTLLFDEDVDETGRFIGLESGAASMPVPPPPTRTASASIFTFEAYHEEASNKGLFMPFLAFQKFCKAYADRSFDEKVSALKIWRQGVFPAVLANLQTFRPFAELYISFMSSGYIDLEAKNLGVYADLVNFEVMWLEQVTSSSAQKSEAIRGWRAKVSVEVFEKLRKLPIFQILRKHLIEKEFDYPISQEDRSRCAQVSPNPGAFGELNKIDNETDRIKALRLGLFDALHSLEALCEKHLDDTFPLSHVFRPQWKRWDI
jgi:hypothetical protein